MDEASHGQLVEILSRIIPESAEMPGAGESKAPEFVASQVDGDRHLAELFEGGLQEINQCSVRAGGRFGDLPDDMKDRVLMQVEESHPEFFAALVTHTYRGYYSDERVLGRLGEELRPPQPSGHRVHRGDLSGLKAVRERGPIYRIA